MDVSAESKTLPKFKCNRTNMRLNFIESPFQKKHNQNLTDSRVLPEDRDRFVAKRKGLKKPEPAQGLSEEAMMQT